MTVEIVGAMVARSDLLLRSSRRGGNVLDTLRYVPGSAIRGALGARWVEHHGADELFRSIFLSGRVRFHDARADIDGHEAFAVPLTFVTSKEHPLAAHTFDLVTGRERPEGVALKRVRGEVTLAGVLREGGPPTVVRSRIGTFAEDSASTVDPARAPRALHGLAADGQLFSETRIAAGTTFTVRVSGDPELVAELAGRVLPRDRADSLRIGRSRTVLGLTDVSWSEVHDVTRHAIAMDGEHTLVALSDLVLLDPYQRAVVDITPEALAEMLGVAADEVEVLPGGEVRATTVGGWDGVNRMPARVDHAIRAGSTVRFRAPSDAVRRLAEEPWVGWRRPEGHGHVAVDWPVHRLETLHTSPSQIVLPIGPEGPDGGLAGAAKLFLERFGVSEAPRSTRWSQVVEAVRAGVDLSHLALAVDTPDDGRDSERKAGRGSGAGERLRSQRRDIATRLVAAFRELGIDSDDRLPDRLAFVTHVGREVRLRELSARSRARKDRVAAGLERPRRAVKSREDRG